MTQAAALFDQYHDHSSEEYLADGLHMVPVRNSVDHIPIYCMHLAAFIESELPYLSPSSTLC